MRKKTIKLLLLFLVLISIIIYMRKNIISFLGEDFMKKEELIKYSLENLYELESTANSLLKINVDSGKYIIFDKKDEVRRTDWTVTEVFDGIFAVFSHQSTPEKGDIEIIRKSGVDAVLNGNVFEEISIRWGTVIFTHRTPIGYGIEIIYSKDDLSSNKELVKQFDLYEVDEFKDGWYYCESR